MGKPKTPLKTEAEIKQEETRVQLAISHALQIKQTFELYAYHIISPYVFATRIKELNDLYEDDYTIQVNGGQMEIK